MDGKAAAAGAVAGGAAVVVGTLAYNKYFKDGGFGANEGVKGYTEILAEGVTRYPAIIKFSPMAPPYSQEYDICGADIAAGPMGYAQLIAIQMAPNFAIFKTGDGRTDYAYKAGVQRALGYVLDGEITYLDGPKIADGVSYGYAGFLTNGNFFATILVSEMALVAVMNPTTKRVYVTTVPIDTAAIKPVTMTTGSMFPCGMQWDPIEEQIYAIYRGFTWQNAATPASEIGAIAFVPLIPGQPGTVLASPAIVGTQGGLRWPFSVFGAVKFPGTDDIVAVMGSGKAYNYGTGLGVNYTPAIEIYGRVNGVWGLQTNIGVPWREPCDWGTGACNSTLKIPPVTGFPIGQKLWYNTTTVAELMAEVTTSAIVGTALGIEAEAKVAVNYSEIALDDEDIDALLYSED